MPTSDTSFAHLEKLMEIRTILLTVAHFIETLATLYAFRKRRNIYSCMLIQI